MTGHLLITIAVLAVTTYFSNAQIPWPYYSDLNGTAISYTPVRGYSKIWNSNGTTNGSFIVSIWAVDNPATHGYCSLGDVAVGNFGQPTRSRIGIAVIGVLPEALVHPTSFQQVWNDQGSGAYGNCAIHTMTAPAGYTCLGAAAVNDYYTTPNKSRYCCVKDEYLIKSSSVLTYSNANTTARLGLNIWTVVQHTDLTSDQSVIAGNNFYPRTPLVNGVTTPKENVYLLKNDTVEVKQCDYVDIKDNMCYRDYYSQYTY